jgi:hypothetical protein
MKVFEFADVVDGRTILILAMSRDDAAKKAGECTALKLEYVGSKSLLEIETPFVILNDVLPF